MFDAISSLSKTFDDINIVDDNYEFVYFIDYRNIWHIEADNILSNFTPDYRMFLKKGLNHFAYLYPKSKFEIDRNKILEIIKEFIHKIEMNIVDKCSDKSIWFSRMLDKPSLTFRESIQRMLFINMILWQTNHRLIGLGHWDVMFNEYYCNDIATGLITRKDAYTCICGVLTRLHKDYKFKSNLLLGDTGQIITVGSSTIEFKYMYNELTTMIIEAVANSKQPEPKVILRVNNDTPRMIFEVTLRSLATGCGSPLISNDEVVLPSLVDYGIPLSDAVEYGSSACWEPLITGKDSSLNNITTLNFLRSLNNVFQRDKMKNINSFEQLKKRYFLYLSLNINAIKRVISLRRFQYDPVLSLFIIGCHEKSCDVSHGGAIYHDVGITTVAISNTVNALLNIKEMVFDKCVYTLDDVKEMILTNFNKCEDLPNRLKLRENAFGVDNSEIIQLTNEITRFVSSQTTDYRNYLNGKMKFGLSAPSYIDAARGFPASFDGRLRDAPFAVHISNENVKSHTTILSFAGTLDYGGNRFNGNVVDLIITPSLLVENKEKYIEILIASIKIGFFQMQINVVSSQILIDAKKSPEKYANLIVRVWGFSAYMANLPEEYQDVLIARALENEKRIAM
jgi:formate C-acetyltransferase